MIPGLFLYPLLPEKENLYIHMFLTGALIFIAGSISIIAWQGWKGFLSLIVFWVDMHEDGPLDSMLET